jgi:hypothetical protein
MGLNMFKRIKQALATIGLKPLPTPTTNKSPIVSEDEAAIQQRKRIQAEFDKQHKDMQSRALMPHSLSCLEPQFCTKYPCFKWEPDKIVREFFVNNKLKEVVATEEKKE